MNLTDVYSQIADADAVMLEKQAAHIKVAEEEDAAGRIMARGFADELTKIAGKSPGKLRRVSDHRGNMDSILDAKMPPLSSKQRVISDALSDRGKKALGRGKMLRRGAIGAVVGAALLGKKVVSDKKKKREKYEREYTNSPEYKKKEKEYAVQAFMKQQRAKGHTVERNKNR